MRIGVTPIDIHVEIAIVATNEPVYVNQYDVLRNYIPSLAMKMMRPDPIARIDVGNISLM